MSITKLASGRWRARCWHDGKNIPVGPVLGLPAGTTWETKREAKAAREKAREVLAGLLPSEVTVGQWWERWTSDPLFKRPKESTNIHNRERTKLFAAKYGTLRLHAVRRQLVTGEWLAGGRNLGTVPALRAMFNDAVREELIDRNPFAGLGLSRGRGNADVQPPSPELVWEMIAAARRVAVDSFAGWLQVAAFTGMRPGELDALRWDGVDFGASRIAVVEQFSAKTRSFTLPKNGQRRLAALTPEARDALVSLPRESEFCFSTLRRSHWTPSARASHWKAVKAAVGWDGTLYQATRHFAGSWMINVQEMAPEDVAICLGHTDGGSLVRLVYGHRDQGRALDRAIARGSGVSLEAVRDQTG